MVSSPRIEVGPLCFAAVASLVSDIQWLCAGVWNPPLSFRGSGEEGEGNTRGKLRSKGGTTRITVGRCRKQSTEWAACCVRSYTAYELFFSLLRALRHSDPFRCLQPGDFTHQTSRTNSACWLSFFFRAFCCYRPPLTGISRRRRRRPVCSAWVRRQAAAAAAAVGGNPRAARGGEQFAAGSG